MADYNYDYGPPVELAGDYSNDYYMDNYYPAYDYGPPAELAGAEPRLPMTDYGTPSGWYDDQGNWNSYADVAATQGDDALYQYLTGGQYYDVPSTDWWEQAGGFLDKYGRPIVGGLGMGIKIWELLQQQDLADAQRKKIEAETKALAERSITDRENQVLNYANDVDKQKLILGRMQEKGMLAPGIDPNQLLGRSYANAQSVFGPGTRYNLNTFASSPFSQVPVWTPLPSASAIGMAHGGPVESRAGSGLSALGGGQADDVPINASAGEYIVDASTVSDLGDGNTAAGGLALDRMVANVRKHKRAKAKGLPPKAKAPEQYMKKGR